MGLSVFWLQTNKPRLVSCMSRVFFLINMQPKEQKMSIFSSIDQLAERFNENPFRISYAIRKARIQAADRIGNVRRFSSDQVKTIQAAVQAIRRKSA